MKMSHFGIVMMFTLLCIGYAGEVGVSHKTPVPKSITLESNAITVNVGDTVQLSVVGKYSDGSSNTIDENITYTITPNDSAEMNGSVLIAKKDANVTVQATVGSVNSNTLNLTITWVVDGHVLPPEPDPVVNNATLLGVDVNDNGVRDDVERYIYERFGKDPDYPKTKIALAMQDAWATQKILESPTIESKKYLDDAIDCQYYWFNKKQKSINQRIIDENDLSKSIELSIQASKWRSRHKIFIDVSLKDIKLNTKQRILQKFKFNEACSGHIFSGRGKETINNCLYNIDNLGE